MRGGGRSSIVSVVNAASAEAEEGSDDGKVQVAAPPRVPGGAPGMFVPLQQPVLAPPQLPLAGNYDFFLPVLGGRYPAAPGPGGFGGGIPAPIIRGGVGGGLRPVAGGGGAGEFGGLDFEPGQYPGGNVVNRQGGVRRAGELISERWVIDFDERALPIDEFGVLVQSANEILNEAQQDLQIHPGERVAIRVSGNTRGGLGFQETLAFRPWQEINYRSIIGLLEMAIQSDQEIEGEIEVEITVHKQTVFNAQGRNNVDPCVVRECVRKSKVIIFLNPVDDAVNWTRDCLFQFIYMGLCYLAQHGKILPITELGINLNRPFERLLKDAARYHYRKKGGDRVKQKFGENISDLDLFQAVKDTYDVQVVIYEYSPMFDVIYPLDVPVVEDRPLLNGMGYTATSDFGNNKIVSHLDFITKPSALPNFWKRHAAKSKSFGNKSCRQCARCFELYVRKQGCSNEECSDNLSTFCALCHHCPNTCKGCQSQECGALISIPTDLATVPFNERVNCHRCFTKLFSPKCLEMHDANCKARLKLVCANCGKNYHGNTECHMTMCYLCTQKVSSLDREGHQCYIQKEKPPKPVECLLAYDFECVRSSTGVHIPYLCTAVIMKSPVLDALVAKLMEEFVTRTVNGQVMFIFWGLLDENLVKTKEITDSVLDFWIFLEKLKQPFTCFAHNAKAYDSIIVKNVFAKRGFFSDDVTRGRKILSMSFPDLGLRFIDSTNFIPSALRNLSADFGVNELAKGFFPHAVMSEAYFKQAEQSSFKVILPPRSEFEPKYGAGKAGQMEEEEFEKFWVNLRARNLSAGGYCIREEAITYCISDTLLLATCLVLFQENFQDMVAKFSRDFDPFAFMTLPSAMMNLFLSSCLEKNSIGIIDRAPILMRRSAYLLFSYLESEQLCGMFELLTDSVALFEQDNLLVIYSNCYNDGCLKCFAPFMFNNRKKCFMHECRTEFTNSIRKWTSRYPRMRVKVMNQHCMEIPEWFARAADEYLPLDPREAYKGGKVEVFKLVHDAPLQMCDFVSEYPTTLLGNSYDPLSVDDPSKKLSWPFPVGIPEILVSPPNFKYDEGLAGIIKCKILPPKGLYAPFLSYRVYSSLKDYEVMYGLCKECMNFRTWPCTHTDEERAFTGTWTLAEMDHAFSIGYKLVSIREMWIYPTARTDIFREFITPFMAEKILSKKDGLVGEDESFTLKGVKVQEYLESLTGHSYHPNAFSNAPARRTVAKLAQNSFTGKWGEIEVHRSSKVFNDKTMKDLWKLFGNSDVTMRYASIIDEGTKLIVAEYEMRSLASRTARKKNDVIVAYITAYGRIMLSRLEQKLGRALIYEDTDSAFHSMLEVPAYIDGFRTGDLELELKEATNWVSLGRKWYTYTKPGAAQISKLKGFTLRRLESELTSSSKLKKYLAEVADYLRIPDDEKMEEDRPEPILIPQMVFQTAGGNNPLLLHKQTHNVEKKAQFLVDKLKRFVDLSHFTEEVDFVDSLPFGY